MNFNQLTYKLYIIFHKTLYEECYKKLSKKQFDQLTFFAVNSTIQKEVPEMCMNQIIIERNLPYYNPLWQHSNFCESSVFLHVYKNEKLLNNYDYVGFFQYDMIIEPSVLETIETTLEKYKQNNFFFYHFKENSNRHLDQAICLDGWSVILKLYNILFKTNHAIEQITSEDIPLYHAFVLPKHIFQKMMAFCEVAFPHIFEMLACGTKHLPYHLERLHGIFLICQKLEGHLPHWVHLEGIIHNDMLKDGWQTS
jgi:hypothetical protein